MTVLDDFEGTHTLGIKWSKGRKAEVGNSLDPDDLQDTPTVKLWWAQENAAGGPEWKPTQYIVVATDPDAPSRNDPKWSEICHWIATGVAIPDGKNSRRLSFKTFWDVIPYKPPGPPEKTGKHRYVFVAYTAANGTSAGLHLSKPSDRQHWGYGKGVHGVRNWAEDNGLKPVGRFTAARLAKFMLLTREQPQILSTRKTISSSRR